MRKLRAETLNTLPGILASKRERSYGHTSASGKSGRQISTKMLPKDSFTLDWSVGLTARARELGSQQKLLSFSQPSLSPSASKHSPGPAVALQPMAVFTAKATAGKTFNEREQSASDGVSMGARFAEWAFLGRKTFPLCQWPSNSGPVAPPACEDTWGRGPGAAASPEDRSLCVRRKLMASRMMEAL